MRYVHINGKEKNKNNEICNLLTIVYEIMIPTSDSNELAHFDCISVSE